MLSLWETTLYFFLKGKETLHLDTIPPPPVAARRLTRSRFVTINALTYYETLFFSAKNNTTTHRSHITARKCLKIIPKWARAGVMLQINEKNMPLYHTCTVRLIFIACRFLPLYSERFFRRSIIFAGDGSRSSNTGSDRYTLTGIGAHFDDLPILHHKHAEMSELDKDNNCTYHTHIWLHKVLYAGEMMHI